MGQQDPSKLKKAAEDIDTDLPDEDEDLDVEGDVEEEGKEEADVKGGEKKVPSIEELQDELDRARIALKKANRESAKRRLELKQLKETGTKKPEGSGEEEKAAEKLQAEYDKVQKQLADLQAENHSLKLRGTIRSKAAEMKLTFFSDEALDDALGRIQESLDEDSDDEDLVMAIKQVAKARPYLFRKAEKQSGEDNGSGTDAAKKGSSEVIVTAEEEAEIGRRFNIKP